MPLSFYTAPPKRGEPPPYHDELGPDGLLHYRYRGTDPDHRDNVGMKLAARRKVPLIYLYGIVPGEYLPIWPVYVVGHDDAALTFRVAVDDHRFAMQEVAGFEEDMKRAYIARVTVHRLHQESFRRRVLRAYRERSDTFSWSRSMSGKKTLPVKPHRRSIRIGAVETSLVRLEGVVRAAAERGFR